MARASVAATNTAMQAVLPTPGTYFYSLHIGDTGTTGTNEMTGVTRVAFPASVAAAGVVNNTAAMTITNPGSVPATYGAVWSLVTGGVFVIGAALSSPVTAASIVFAIGSASFQAA